MAEFVLLSDPRIAALPVKECGDPRVDLRTMPVIRLDHRLADPEGARGNATPPESDEACYTASTEISEESRGNRGNRDTLGSALTSAGFAFE
ncbi:hypothetical protein DQ384_08075 [Sphaerisporangium album]|uniref:Uncharacterized protein n=1 Tax=Sphaerisporangium album TaxID=509200 RepID=A0A367FPB7_9ACTN|nr:hypothetical protein [Sphaerisporangium album]RCG31530.1 hypothetical protein DQ384_08075 [Sphaerisporangium album]